MRERRGMGSPVEMDLPVSIDRDQPLPGTKVLALVINPFVNDSRVLRENRTLAEHGYDVTLLALHESGLPVEESLFGFRVIRVPLRTRSWSKTAFVQLVKYAECAFRMVRAGYQIRPSVVHAHDLNTLPIGFIIARISGAALIYDSHEYWAGAASTRRFPKWLQWLGLRMERMLARRADTVITVSPGIVERLEIAFENVPVVLVRNLPDRPRDESGTAAGGIREHLGLAPSVPLLLYQGGVFPGRGVEVAIAAMARLAPPTHLAILGHGPPAYVAGLVDRVRREGVGDRVSFVKPVPPGALIQFARSADFGLCPLETQWESYALALPNKVFEYLQSGLPIIHSGSDEVRRLLDQYGVGRWFAEGDAAALAAVVQQWLANPAECGRLREHCRRAAAELHWDNEQRELLAIYSQVANR
jgi:glycosyltransferase involved in cell wall biosynthesis